MNCLLKVIRYRMGVIIFEPLVYPRTMHGDLVYKEGEWKTIDKLLT